VKTFKSVLFCISLLFLFFRTTVNVNAVTFTPANPNATNEAKQVLNYLGNLPNNAENRVISGQHLWHGLCCTETGYNDYVANLKNKTGKWVGLIGVDYGVKSTPSQIDSTNRNVLIPWWESGGLITIDYHVYSPWTGGSYRDFTDRNLNELSDPSLNPQVYDRWIAELDKIAAGFKQLQNTGVVILWRPFHEMNYSAAFWWDAGGHPGDAQPYIKMWRHMFNYLTYEKGLNNLLWVYSPADIYPWHLDNKVEFRYPGGNYVDIVGLDKYSNTMEPNVDNYAKLIAFGKPFAITETGPASAFGTYDTTKTINSIRNNYPKAVYFQYWHDKWAIVNQQNYSQLLNDSWVVTRDEIDWKGPTQPVSPSPSPPPKSGDGNDDGAVDGKDFIIWLIHFGQNVSGANNGDFNDNGKVEMEDYMVWITNFSM
jgi:mannan endo-1,4-beta-mannosidase